MNTLKFVSNEKLTTESHNPQEEYLKEVNIGDNIKAYCCPLNFTIVIDPRCNSRCEFCIFHEDEMAESVSDELYFYKLDSVFNKLRKLPIEITITGGEPTLFPNRLIGVLKLTQKYGLRHRTFSTNGIGLLSLYNGKPILQYMKECGAVRNINLSRMTFDQKQNDSIFNSKTLSLDEIKKIAMFCDLNDMDLRLSCNLMKSQIHTSAQIFDYLNTAEEVNIKNTIFRELVNYKKEFVPIKEIMNELTEKFILNKTYNTNTYNIKEFTFKNYHVKEYQTLILPYKTWTSKLVYQEGRLFDGWNLKKEIPI